jgi:hypothetical protein
VSWSIGVLIRPEGKQIITGNEITDKKGSVNIYDGTTNTAGRPCGD